VIDEILTNQITNYSLDVTGCVFGGLVTSAIIVHPQYTTFTSPISTTDSIASYIVQFDRKRVFSTPIPLLYPICVVFQTVNMTMIG
jgi:hypothetical protein